MGQVVVTFRVAGIIQANAQARLDAAKAKMQEIADTLPGAEELHLKDLRFVADDDDKQINN